MFDSKFFIAKKFLDFDFPSGWAMFVAKKNHSQIILLILRVFPIHLDWQSTLYFDSSKSSRPFFHLPDNNTNDFIYLLWLEGQKSFESSINLIIESIRSIVIRTLTRISEKLIDISFQYLRFFIRFNLLEEKYTVNLSTTIVQETLYSFYLETLTRSFFLVSVFVRVQNATKQEEKFSRKNWSTLYKKECLNLQFFFLIILVKSLLNNVNVIFPFTKYSNETGGESVRMQYA